MPRVKRGTNRRDYRKKTLERASGFFLTKSKLNRAAQEAVEKAQKYAYVGRKQKKRYSARCGLCALAPPARRPAFPTASSCMA